MIKACLFDLDGTLLNTLKSIRHYVNKNISQYNIKELDEDETRMFVGEGAKKLIKNILESRGFDLNDLETLKLLDNIHRSYVDEYDSEPAYLTEPYDGICDAVKQLKLFGIKLAVISNKPDATVKQLSEKFFGESFSIVEGARDKMPLKPEASWPLDICKRLGVNPSEVMYVGDTSTDMKTAKNFGAGLAVGVLWGFRDRDELIENGSDVLISSPSELVNLALNKR